MKLLERPGGGERVSGAVAGLCVVVLVSRPMFLRGWEPAHLYYVLASQPANVSGAHRPHAGWTSACNRPRQRPAGTYEILQGSSGREEMGSAMSGLC